MEKEVLKNDMSDVGQQDLFINLKNTSDLVSRDFEYNQITEDIRSSIDDVFRGYLEIGSLLNTCNVKELYLVNDYKDIYEYAKEQFDFSPTTTKNVIGIVNKFTNEDDQLLEKYEKCSFSHLVELLPVDDKDIDLFIPSMTVKAVRSKKLELEINKQIEEEFSVSGSLTKVISTVESFDFSKYIEFVDDFDIKHNVKKEKYTAADKGDRWNGYNYFSILIEFFITSGKKKVRYVVNVDLKNFKMRLNCDNPWFYRDFEDMEDLDSALISLCEKLKDQFEVSSDAIKQKSNNIYDKLVNFGKRYMPGTYLYKLGLYISTNIFGYYYESVSYKDNHLILYSDPIKDNKKNPKVYELVDLDNPFTASIINCNNGEKTLIFSGFEKYFKKELGLISSILNE